MKIAPACVCCPVCAGPVGMAVRDGSVWHYCPRHGLTGRPLARCPKCLGRLRRERGSGKEPRAGRCPACEHRERLARDRSERYGEEPNRKDDAKS